MSIGEKVSSTLTEIEDANTPLEAVEAAGRPLRRVVGMPMEIGHDVLKIVMNGNAVEAVRAAAHIR